MAAITLNIGGNTRQLDRDIQKTVNKVYNINLKSKGDQPLGRITGQVNEFNKSLDASNARVIAFGASAGIIFGVERAFTALVSATIEVQKSLQDINVILNASQGQLQKFGGELFNIAKNTGQSFQEVAKAATEFSRQGLGIEETLKRTSEALILSRLSGLDAAKSVESLTAAVNSFASQAVTATEVVNKFATVDAAFAVSSADLADAIARVGSSAAQSGVSLNELIAIVTSAQQTTARGGAVIGNSFKTIFTRLQREKVVDLLESLGISGTDSSGQVKSTIQLLQDLGAVYDTLGSQQQAYVAEQVGGVFQINILKAALADLGKEYSIYSSALNVAAGATDQAIRRNEELNKTYSAQINALAENARQLAAAGGERLLGPSIDRLVGGTNTLLKGFSESDGQGVGAVLGKGILDGLGQFIAGPGLALIGGVLLKLFRDLGKFATGSVQQLLGLNTAATQQKDLQQSISQILAKNPQLLELALKGEQGLNTAANSLLASLQKQTVELQKQAQVAAQISKAFVAQAGVRVAGGVPVVPTPKTGRTGKAAGYIPNFASDKLVEKYTAISLGATSSVRPHMSQGTIGGRKFVMNNQEVEFPGVGKNGDSMVLPTYGDGPRIAAAGFIPNFADEDLSRFRGNRPGPFVLPKDYEGKGKTRERNKLINYQQKYGYLLPPGFGRGALSGSKKKQIPPGIPFASPNPKRISTEAKDEAGNDIKSIENLLLDTISNSVSLYTNTLQPLGKTVSPKQIKAQFGSKAIGGAKGALSALTGAGFEIGITQALGYEAAAREAGGDFDVRGGIKLGDVQKLFGLNNPLMDFKVSLSRRNTDSFYDKIIAEEGLGPNRQEFKPEEQATNARSLARSQTKEKYEDFFQKEGYQIRFSAPLEKRKEIEAYEKSRIAENMKRFVNLGPMRRGAPRSRAAGYIPNFAAPLVRAVDDKELRMMLSKFGKGFAFQNKSFDQSAMEYFGGSGTYMWDALSRPGEQISDRQAYKQNIGRAKNWSSARKQSSWLVRYNRSKLKDSELLPDMETGGASVYGLPLSKDQIVWPIKQSGGSGRIFEKDIPAFLSGQLNDAIKRESEAGVPKNKIYLAQEKALTSANPMGLGVFNKKDEPTKGSRKDAMRRKGFASGFVPNFAIEDPDTQAAGLGSSIGAVVAQLGFLAFSLQGSREQYKQSLEELTRTNVAQAKINTSNVREQAKSKIDYSSPAAFKESRKQAADEIREARKQEKVAAKGTGGQKFAAASGAGGFALSLGAPVIAETIKNAIGQETAGARKTGAAVSAAGQVASFAGAGAMFGPWGVAIGAATGALLTVPGLIDEMTATAPEFAKAAAKASQDLTKFNDAGQRVLTSSSELSKLLKEGGSKNSIQKAQEAYNKSLLELSSVDRQRLGSAAKVGKLEEEYAKVLAEKVAKERSAQSETALAGVRDEIASDKTKTGIVARAASTVALPGIGTALAPFIGSFAANQKDYLNLGTEEGRKRRTGIAETFTTELRGNKGPEEFLKSLRDIKIPKEVTNKAQFDNFVNGLKELPNGFKNTLKEIAAEDPEAAFQLLRAQIVYLKKDTADFIQDSAALQAAEKERQDILKQEQAAIDATVSSIQKNIAVQNLWKSAIDNINESIRSFSEDLKITQTLTQPREVLGGLIGEDKTPTRRLAAQEGLARIDATTRSGLATAGIDFKETFRGITQEPFQENIDKIVKKLGEQGGALAGEPEDIIKQSTQFQSEAKAEEQKLLKATENMEAYLSKFISGQMSTNQLLEASKQELGNVGIDINRGSQASDSIEKAVAELQVKSIQEQVKAFQQRAKLASETKQAILQSRIEQALNTFGGFEGFMNRPEEEGNYIQRISPDLKKIEQIRSSTAFRYNNKDSIKEQEKQAPELGRSLTNVYKELINQSGGAFRDFLQKEVDTISNVTGSEGRSGLAGAGGGGGVSDILRGREVDLENQLKLAEDKLKITTDPLAKRILEGFISSIKSAPAGLKGVAALQTQKELGVANQSDFAKLYGKYENEALNRLKDISPTLAASLESAISLSDDPLVAEAQLQSLLQTDMVGYLGPIQSALLQIANSGGASVTQTGVPKIEGYAPKLTEQQQKKADEFRKKQEEVAKKEADIKAKKAQEAALPKDNRTSAEIEAETRAKRDQKYLPTSRETGKKFENVSQIEDEMAKLRSMGPMTEKDSTYYKTLDRFKTALNPVADMSTFEGRVGAKLRENIYLEDIDRNTPMSATTQIQAGIERARDQRLSGIINPQGILSPNLNLGPNSSVGQQDIQSQIGSQIKPLADIGTNLRPLSDISNDVTRANYDMDVKRKGLYEGNIGAELERRKLAENPLLTLAPQQVTTQGPQALEQSFTQQEAAFSNNTSALTTLATSIETLNSTITNTQSTNGNVNSPTSQQAGAQPQVSTNTNAPVSVVVNAQGGTDISTAVGQAVQNAIPSIVEKVRIAMGEKVPPTVSRPPLTTNPKFGAGQRADGGFLL
jgi:TP901 family phage tail tape measure protein